MHPPFPFEPKAEPQQEQSDQSRRGARGLAAQRRTPAKLVEHSDGREGLRGRLARVTFVASSARKGKHLMCGTRDKRNPRQPAPETLPEGPKKYFQKSCCAANRLLCILIPAAHASGNKRERLPGELAQFG